MNNRKISYIIILVAAIALLVVISPVGAEHTETHMSPVDAKTSQSVGQDNASGHVAIISAMRWQAMADFYKDSELSIRDSFDYERAADVSAARWQGMADFYADSELSIRDSFDYERVADVSAARWQAMAVYYTR